ncbi:SDR family NAD(P)-dependent oxidoreductase [Streptomyces sp. AC550_RSS872]|uniref:SDR family NAD(P)-dependent oxidoreductase n=1 Tax=Streptomyces sp. AC550_RSS872 TaxID=2823689 RepID=UPI001C26F895|nr:SDR family NAD(P)-dependent oxidoreductase [Streptomyces sp. AC550_RSS872]
MPKTTNPATHWTAADIPDLTGQTWLITGATNGLGLSTAREAHAKGARLILAVRDTTRGEQLTRELSGADVLQLDLASLDSVREAAAQVSNIDVLINNAGTSPQQRTEWAVHEVMSVSG